MAAVDQHDLAIATETLRVQMLGIQADLVDEFQQAGGAEIPAEILDFIGQLHQVMEAVTLNQAATTFALSKNALEDAEEQQRKALEGFARAEELFDKIRREVVAALDEYDLPDPDIAALQDPTLDRFLARLEREPNIEAQLGIPDRPQNLRVLADDMEWQQRDGRNMLDESLQAAARRAREAMKRNQKERGKPSDEDDDEKEVPENVADLKEMIAASLKRIEEEMKDPKVTEAQRKQMEQVAENLRRMLKQAGDRKAAADAWKRLVESDQAKATLKALARGERLPDEQWNKILSSLDEGLWQTKGRTPPEEYRKSIEQYQEQIRRLENAVENGVDPKNAGEQ
jgi:hypothetical protein